MRGDAAQGAQALVECEDLCDGLLHGRVRILHPLPSWLAETHVADGRARHREALLDQRFLRLPQSLNPFIIFVLIEDGPNAEEQALARDLRVDQRAVDEDEYVIELAKTDEDGEVAMRPTGA